jgi:ubiquinol-cytochrome c reductase iron-sulfur subunit
MAHALDQASGAPDARESRRDFLYLVTGLTAAAGTGAALVPLIDSMNPSADVLATSTTTVDLAGIEPGMAITVVWRGKPVFVRHRTAEEIAAAEEVDPATLRDPAPDAARVERPEWLVVIGVCTHLGCVPLGQKPGDPRGDWGGWFCACHGSHYDTAGRIRKGPAPRNLDIPAYTFLEDATIRIG